MNYIVTLAVCIFLILCPPHKRAKSSARLDARSKSCDALTKGFEGTNTDAWVSAFPVDQQHRVLVCLDKRAKKRGEVK